MSKALKVKEAKIEEIRRSVEPYLPERNVVFTDSEEVTFDTETDKVEEEVKFPEPVENREESEVVVEESTVDEIKEEPVVEENNLEREEQRKEDIKEEYTDATQVYQFVDEINTQRVKTQEATREASQLAKEFETYQAESRRQIDDSNRRLQEANQSKSMAEERYQKADQLHKDALNKLLETGNKQQTLLRKREKDARAQIISITEKRKEMEESTNQLLSTNERKVEEYTNHAAELNSQTEKKNQEAEKWEAIIRAMETPEEDFMGLIDADSYQEAEISYGKAM